MKYFEEHKRKETKSFDTMMTEILREKSLYFLYIQGKEYILTIYRASLRSGYKKYPSLIASIKEIASIEEVSNLDLTQER